MNIDALMYPAYVFRTTTQQHIVAYSSLEAQKKLLLNASQSATFLLSHHIKHN